MRNPFLFLAISVFLWFSCRHDAARQQEQLRVSEEEARGGSGEDSSGWTQGPLYTMPNEVLLTGLPQHRLISVYRVPLKKEEKNIKVFKSRSYYDEGAVREEHYMPGIDVLFGWNLVNLAHYDLQSEKMNMFFNKPVLIKTLYYPAFVQDSVNKQPINRNYYLVSVYDEDTNNDTVINRSDLRRFYCFSADGHNRIQLVPADHSVIRSQYDPQNDLMYIFTRQDINRNGKQDTEEPMHVFWFSLANPVKAKLMY